MSVSSLSVSEDRNGPLCFLESPSHSSVPRCVIQTASYPRGLHALDDEFRMNFSLDTGKGPSKSGNTELNCGMEEQRIGRDSARCRLGNWRVRELGFVLRQKILLEAAFVALHRCFSCHSSALREAEGEEQLSSPMGGKVAIPGMSLHVVLEKSLSQAPWKGLISSPVVFNVV